MSIRDWLKRHIVGDDPNPQPSLLDILDGVGRGEALTDDDDDPFDSIPSKDERRHIRHATPCAVTYGDLVCTMPANHIGYHCDGNGGAPWWIPADVDTPLFHETMEAVQAQATWDPTSAELFHAGARAAMDNIAATQADTLLAETSDYLSAADVADEVEAWLAGGAK